MSAVTAAITTCRRPVPIVERALKSVVSQTYDDIRIFVVNDYPEDPALSDALKDMCRRYDGRFPVTYLTTGKNSGACRARNVALEAAETPYIAFLDDDDEWYPDKTALQVDALEKTPEAALCYCNVRHCYSDGRTEIRNSGPMPEGMIFHDLVAFNIIGSCSFPMLLTEAFREVGGFNESMPALQDLEAYMRLCRIYPAVYISDPLVDYHIEQIDRISSSMKRRADGCARLEDAFRDVIKNDRNDRAAMALRCLFHYSNDHRAKDSVMAWCRAVAARPEAVATNLKKLRQVVRSFTPDR